MVVCQYFLQGRCHFGVNCKNEHIYNNNNGGRGGRNTGNNQLNNIVWQISNEVSAAEKGGQWPLSCFAPLKEGPCLPGWEDISPEEVRWTLYEAQKNGTVNQALNQINQWYKNAEKARALLKQPTQEIINLLYDMKGKKGQTTAATTGSFATTTTPDPKSSFRFDTAMNNLYGKGASSGQNSIFGGSSSGFQGHIIFGGQPAMASGGLFSKPQESNHNPFSTSNNSPFPNNGGSIFQNSNVNRNIFQSQTTSNVFQSGALGFGGFSGNSSVFGGSQNNQFQSQNQSQLFGGVPNKANTPPIIEDDASVYSKVEDLNENEIKAFTSTTFTFGNIPLKPPPQQYC